MIVPSHLHAFNYFITRCRTADWFKRGRRRHSSRFLLMGVTSSVAKLNSGSVASLHWRCLRGRELKTFQVPNAVVSHQIALCKYPSADASQSHSCNTRKVFDWLLSLCWRIGTQASYQTARPSSVDARLPRVNGPAGASSVWDLFFSGRPL